MSTGHLQIVVLAAGASTRLGRPKQLEPIAGQPALQHVLSNAVAVAGSAVTVVFGAHAATMSRMLQHSAVSMLVNRDWQEGIAASIRCGVKALPGACDALLLLLGDQVAITAMDLRRLIAAWQANGTRIAASLYAGQHGVPAIFPRACFTELLELRGDQGAKAIIHRHANSLTAVAMPHAALDLDTPDDVAALQAHFEQP